MMEELFNTRKVLRSREEILIEVTSDGSETWVDLQDYLDRNLVIPGERPISVYNFKKEHVPLIIAGRESEHESDADFDFTVKEQRVFEMSGELAAAFFDLPVLHPDHHHEFAHHLHDIQRMIAYRPMRRVHPEHFSKVDNNE